MGKSPNLTRLYSYVTIYSLNDTSIASGTKNYGEVLATQ